MKCLSVPQVCICRESPPHAVSPPTALSMGTGKKVPISNWHDMRAKQWDGITLHYSKCYFSFQLLPLCRGAASYWNSPSVGRWGQYQQRDCFTIDRCGLFLEEAQVQCQGLNTIWEYTEWLFAFNISNNKHVLILYRALSSSGLCVICFYCLYAVQIKAESKEEEVHLIQGGSALGVALELTVSHKDARLSL